MRILIIEDNQDLQAIFKNNFEVAGHQVKIAGDGLNGITDAVEFEPDIVILDLMMPEMNGYDFLSALKNNTSMNPYVIACSNLSQQKDIDQAYQAGADAYLRKSDYVGTDLVKEVEKLYGERPVAEDETLSY